MGRILTGDQIPAELVQKLADLLKVDPKRRVVFLGGRPKDYRIHRDEKQILHHSDEELRKKTIPTGTIAIVALTGNLSQLRDVATSLPDEAMVIGYSSQNSCKNVFGEISAKLGAVRAEATFAQQRQAEVVRPAMAVSGGGGIGPTLKRQPPTALHTIDFAKGTKEVEMSEQSSQTGPGAPSAVPGTKKRLSNSSLQQLIAELFRGRIDSVRLDTVVREVHKHQVTMGSPTKSTHTSISKALDAIKRRGIGNASAPAAPSVPDSKNNQASRLAHPEESREGLIKKITTNLEKMTVQDLVSVLEVSDAFKTRRVLRELSES
jgi:hypothetical protein